MATTAIKLLTPPALTSYAFVHEPRPPPPPSTGEPKYSVALLWPIADQIMCFDTVEKKQIALRKAIEIVAIQKFGDKAPGLLKSGKLKNPLRSGDEDRADDANFAGMVFCTASSTKKPGMVNRSNVNFLKLAEQAALEGTEFDPREECYSGCTIRASISLFAFDKGVNRGVAVGLNNLQVLIKGERVDGRKKAEEEFTEVEGDGVSDLM